MEWNYKLVDPAIMIARIDSTRKPWNRLAIAILKDHEAELTTAERGFVDDVIEPRRTRPVLADALETALTKRERRPPRKHGNIPL